jgi:hypothetical protein
MAKQSKIEKNAVFGPRVTFNWGFHDAQNDGARGRPFRTESDRVSPETVSPSQRYYFHGYMAGVAAWQRNPVAQQTSTVAWLAFSRNVADPEALKAEIIRDEIRSLSHCLRKPIDDPYVISEGTKSGIETWDM